MEGAIKRVDPYILLGFVVLPVAIVVAVLILMLAPLRWIVLTYCDWHCCPWSQLKPTSMELIGTVLDVALLTLVLTLAH
jgi:hypothetical protein